MSWQIVRHAFVMIFGNFGDAVKASLVPLVAGLIATVAVFSFFDVPLSAMQQMQMGQGEMDMEMSRRFLPALLVMVVVYLFVVSWIAVTWHRFILLEEYPSAMPRLGGMPVIEYAGKTLLLGLVLLLVAAVAGVAFSLVAGLFMVGGTGGMMIGGLIVALGFATVLSWFWFRLAVVLPGTAVGRPMRVIEGWQATRPLGRTLWGVALILVALNIFANLLILPVAMAIPLVGTVVNIAVSWLTLMIGASILTTLYGHVVEGRALI